jgi:hypothetical protein
MRKIPLVLCCLAVVFISLCAHADIVGDPQTQILDGPCGTGATAEGASFSFFLDASGHANQRFCNDTSSTFDSLQLVTTTPNASLFQCSASLNFFNNCFHTFNEGSGLTTITFNNVLGGTFECIGCEDPPLGGGIPSGIQYSIVMDGWVADAEVQVTATVPEPTTLVLLFVGAVGLLPSRKWRLR